MTLDPSIFFVQRQGADDVLVAASSTEVREALIVFFTRLLEAEYVDPEMLHLNGVALGRTGHVDVDVAILSWVAGDPSERRVSIGMWFCYGYWGFMPVRALGLCSHALTALDRASVGSEAYVGILLGLCAAHWTSSLPGDDQARIRSRLLNELPFLEGLPVHEGVAAQVKTLA